MATQAFCQLATLTFVIAVLSIISVECLEFSFPSFPKTANKDLMLDYSNLVNDAIQVTPDLSNPPEVMNKPGRSFYKDAFHLWRKGKGGERVVASFNTTFVLNISPYPTGGYRIGEGLAFIITGNASLPAQSQGKWLGIVNSNQTLSLKEGIVAVEFDTRKSFPEDIDDNHVGLNLNSIYSVKQVSLTSYGINISHGDSLTVQIRYEEKTISVFVSHSDETGTTMNTPVLAFPLNISDYLPEKVYVGFSASTGADTFQRNCVKSWQFHSSKIDKDRNLLRVWITLPVLVFFLIGLAYLMYRARQYLVGDIEEAYPSLEQEIQGSSTAPKKFKLRDLRRATNNFSPKNQLGKGGFGTVYKGLVRDKTVAVKRVSKNSLQGKQEFISEVTTIANLSHRNLVKLIGWCYESNELLIVYEFMPNGSLDKFIFMDDKLEGAELRELTWERRHSIACGVAQALDYLHSGSERRVLHRDVKASNIMLDSDFNAKLGDFGLARTLQRSEQTHHSTKEIAGTPGYMAPESFFTGRATVETDVYAFGVLLLEVVSGRKPGNGNDSSFSNGLVSWVWRLYEKDRILDAVDPRLDGEFQDDEMACVIVLGLACCHPNPSERPSMRTILKVLIGEEAPPILPEEIPAFVWPSMPPSFKEDGETTMQGRQITMFTEITGR